MSSKARNIEILEYKINDLTILIANYEKYNISDKKIDNLRIKKLEYESQLEELQYA
jgi:hypothetical protein